MTRDMGNTFGSVFRITTWGESHGAAVGVVIDGCPAGLPLSEADVQKELDRRRPGQSSITTPRKESDTVQILSGVFEGVTTGTPISMLVWNEDVDSTKYEPLKDLYRPGHADFTYEAKYGIRDYRGGGRASARETVGRVAAGAVAKKLLATVGIRIVGFTRQVGEIRAERVDLDVIEENPVRAPDLEAAKQMIEAIEAARQEGDSLGGIVEVWGLGVPPGLGEPVFDKLDADLGKAMLSIPAVKGVEIGAGFEAARLRGSQSNDEFANVGGRILPRTNNAGGILGGISTGADIVVRIAVKPTSSISRPQTTVDRYGRAVPVEVKGRHDPNICPRVVPVAEAMMALVLVDHWLRQRLARL